MNEPNVTVNILSNTFKHRANIQTALDCIDYWFCNMQQMRENWQNEWLCLEKGKWIKRDGILHKLQQNKDVFKIYAYIQNDGLYFKLLPVGMHYDRTYGYDGVIRGDDELDHTTMATLEQSGEIIEEVFTNGFIMWINSCKTL